MGSFGQQQPVLQPVARGAEERTGKRWQETPLETEIRLHIRERNEKLKYEWKEEARSDEVIWSYVQ